MIYFRGLHAPAVSATSVNARLPHVPVPTKAGRPRRDATPARHYLALIATARLNK